MELFAVYDTSYLKFELPFRPDYLLVFSKLSAQAIIDQLGEDCTNTWVAIGPSTASVLTNKKSSILITSNPSPQGVLDVLMRTPQ